MHTLSASPGHEKWDLAVGTRDSVESLQNRYCWRQELLVDEITGPTGDKVWTVREAPSAYTAS